MKGISKKSGSKYILPAIIGLALLAVILVAVTYTIGDTSALNFKQAMSNEEYNALLIERLKSNLESDRLKAENRALLEGKLEDAQLLATRDAKYSNVDPATAWAIKQTVIAQATASPLQKNQNTPVKLSGIVMDESHIGFNRIDQFTNYWAQDYNKTNLLIFVGNEIATPEQGVICVVIGTPVLDPAIRIKVPGNTGKLKLERADGDWLYISAESGAEFKFNKFTYQLIDARTGEEIPVETPEGAVKESYP